jgi:KDO2-lipid IV(A) lauroyltransferase
VAVVGETIETPAEGKSLRGAARERALHDLTARYTAEIERVVRAYPEQWNWAHRRWKTRPTVEPG